MKRFWLVLATLLGVTVTAVPASAYVQYTLNCSNDPCTGINASNDFGKIRLDQLGSGTALDPFHVQVTVTLAANEVFASTGSGYPITWNIYGSTQTSPGPDLSSITVTSPNSSWFTPQYAKPSDTSNPPPVYSTYKASPFTGNGSCGATTLSCFDYAIAGDWNGTNHHETSLVFDVKKAGGLVLQDFAATTSGGYYFSADIGQCTTHHGETNCSNTFNVASNMPGVKIPEAGSLTLSIAGLAGLSGLIMLQRRRKLARAA